jgi:hypothetical protein
VGWRGWQVWERLDTLDRRVGLRLLSPERELRLVRRMTYGFVVLGLLLGTLDLVQGSLAASADLGRADSPAPAAPPPDHSAFGTMIVSDYGPCRLRVIA